MKPIKHFNSGRMYSAAGQRIYYRRLGDEKVVFLDIDRHIAHIVAMSEGGDENGKLMREYDNMRYIDKAADYDLISAFEKDVMAMIREEGA